MKIPRRHFLTLASYNFEVSLTEAITTPTPNIVFVNIYSPGLTLAIWGSWQK